MAKTTKAVRVRKTAAKNATKTAATKTSAKRATKTAATKTAAKRALNKTANPGGVIDQKLDATKDKTGAAVITGGPGRF